jgi:hypothetical protein
VRVRATDVFGIIVKVRCGKDSETTGSSRVDRAHCARETSTAGPAASAIAGVDLAVFAVRLVGEAFEPCGTA